MDDNLFQFLDQRRTAAIGVGFIRMMLLRCITHNTFFVDPALSMEEGLQYIEQHVNDLIAQFHEALVDLADDQQPRLQELLIASEESVSDEPISEDANTFLNTVRERLILNASLMFLHNRSRVSEDSEEKLLCKNGVVERIFARARLLGKLPLSLFEISLYVTQTFFPDELLQFAIMGAMYSKWDKPSGLPTLMSEDIKEGINFRDIITLILRLNANLGINQMSRVILISASGEIRFTTVTNPLLIAVLMQAPECISELVSEHFADVNAVSPQRFRGVNTASALLLACAIPNMTVMHTLVSHGASAGALFEATRNRQSALSLVLSNYFNTGNEAYFDMARVLLLRSDANPNDELLLTTVPNGWPAITRINLFGYFVALAENTDRSEEVLSRLEEILVLLVQHGAGIHYSDQTNPTDQTNRDLYLEHLGGLNLSLRRQFEFLYNHARHIHAAGLMSPLSFPGR